MIAQIQPIPVVFAQLGFVYLRVSGFQKHFAMNSIFLNTLWKNFAAVIDMLKSVISKCPDKIWEEEKKFYYVTYHIVIFLDYYLSNPVKDFKPFLPYTLCDTSHLPEGAVDDVLPCEFYSKSEMLVYINKIREKCEKLICSSPPEKFTTKWIDEDEINLHGLSPSIVSNYSLLEILFYNFRHVQHHVGQLNLLLRQSADIAADWISQSG